MRKKKHNEKFFFFAAAATLKFTGTESMSMRFSESIISEADNLRLRFRTVIFEKNIKKLKIPQISKSGSLEQLKTINTRVGLCYLYHCLIKCHQFNKKDAQVLSQNLFKTLDFGVLLKLCHLYRNNATKRFKVPRCLTTSGVHLNFSKVFNSQGP